MVLRPKSTVQTKSRAELWPLLYPLKSILWPYRWRIAVVMGLILLTSMLEGLSFSLLVPLTQLFTADSGGSTVPTGLFQVYREWLAVYRVEDRLAILGLALVALFLVKNGLQYLREMLSVRLWFGLSAETRLHVLAGVLRRPYRYFLDCKQGALVQHLYHEPHQVAHIVQAGLEAGANLLTVAVLVGLLVLVSWQMTALVFTMGSLLGVAIWRLSHQAQVDGEECQTVEAEAKAQLTEAIGGIRQVKVFSAEDRVKGVYEKLVHRFRDLHVRHWAAKLIPIHMTELFWIVILGFLLCLPAIGVVSHVQQVVTLVAVFSAVAFRVGPYISRISHGWLTIRFLFPSLQVVGPLLERPGEGGRREQGRLFRTLHRGIQLDDVNFSYHADRPALSHVCLSFNRGETTAIIGPSGSGKSTLADLLVRLYEPTSGRILVDGVDLHEYEPDSWLATIGFVSQDTYIFHGSIGENIAFSKPHASFEEIRAAAMQASAHDFILHCPLGYDTIVGDRGLKLSGGQRQRIAIARALLRDPQILIFDEATSALDNLAEALIHEEIARIARDRTVILIAHRLSTVVRADKIVVLERGTVVEEGTHASLLTKTGGTYAALYGKEPS